MMNWKVFCLLVSISSIGEANERVVSNDIASEDREGLSQKQFNIPSIASLFNCQLDQPCDVDAANLALDLALLFLPSNTLSNALSKYGVNSSGFDPLTIASFPEIKRKGVRIKLSDIKIEGHSTVELSRAQLSTDISSIGLVLKKFKIVAKFSLGYGPLSINRYLLLSTENLSFDVEINPTESGGFRLRDVVIRLSIDFKNFRWKI